MTWTVNFKSLGGPIEVEPDTTLLEATRQAAVQGLSFYAPCGGKGTCGRCRVRIVEGLVSPVTEQEERHIEPESLAEGFRLACQAKPRSALQVEVPSESLAGQHILQVEGVSIPITPDPITTRQVLKPEAPHAAGTAQGPIGLAVDLGTTKIACFLVDLETGTTLAANGILNPQATYGQDVMTRLGYALESPGHLDYLASIAAHAINRSARTMLTGLGLKPDSIEDVVVAGNTAMHHLLLRLPVEQLARAPYVPAISGPIDREAQKLGIESAPDAQVHFIPPVAGFVGGDHIAMIMATGINEAHGNILGLDIGTNTEIVLSVNGSLSSCSCASGPAFEGAHIYQGMGAVEGAIYEVHLDGDGRTPRYKTIGGRPPVGFCGSGILDMVSELVRLNIVNSRGVLNRSHPRVRETESSKRIEFVLLSASGTGLDRDIVLTQKDVGEIQLAKGAIASGNEILLQTAGITKDQVNKVIVAGAFGTNLRLESAIRIGLLPDLPLDRFLQVGNAAGAGARIALISEARRRLATEIARKIKYVELASSPGFSRVFSKSLRFPTS